MGPFVFSCGQRSYIRVKGHQRSSCKMGSKCTIGSKCKIHLIWKVEIRLEPKLVYWYNLGTFKCSWGQRSWIKVKGHVRLTCKIAWKCKIWLFCIFEDNVTPTGVGSRSGVNSHHPQNATAGNTSVAVQGPWSIFFCCYGYVTIFCTKITGSTIIWWKIPFTNTAYFKSDVCRSSTSNTGSWLRQLKTWVRMSTTNIHLLRFKI